VNEKQLILRWLYARLSESANEAGLPFEDLDYFGYGDIVEARVNSCHPDAKPEYQLRIAVKIKDHRKRS